MFLRLCIRYIFKIRLFVLFYHSSHPVTIKNKNLKTYWLRKIAIKLFCGVFEALAWRDKQQLLQRYHYFIDFTFYHIFLFWKCLAITFQITDERISKRSPPSSVWVLSLANDSLQTNTQAQIIPWTVLKYGCSRQMCGALLSAGSMDISVMPGEES